MDRLGQLDRDEKVGDQVDRTLVAQVPPPEPFEPEDQFLDVVQLLDPLVPQRSERVLK